MSKTAFIFPGQGSQFIGMGKDIYENSNVAKEVFLQIDKSLGFSLSDLIFNGSEEDLQNTENTQPALMAVSMAILSSIMDLTKLPIDKLCHAVAGHSLGEYSALSALGYFNINDTAKLLKIRGNLMGNCLDKGEGAMIAIIGVRDKEIIDNVIIEANKIANCQVANENGGGQYVISGKTSAIDYIQQNSKELKLRRVVKLPVSSAFHSKLMQPAQDAMELELKKFDNDIKFITPIYTNVTAKPVTEGALITDLLTKQITGTVKWEDTINNMIADGIDHFIEIGAGNVLTNLIKKINSDVKTQTISNYGDIKEFVNNFVS